MSKELSEAPVKARVILKSASRIVLRVETGKVVFTPVAYNTFEVGSVAIEAEFPASVDVQAAIAEMDEVVSDNFKINYVRKLESYIKALRYNARKLSEDKEAHRG
jgi:hypothetical protein